jgi:hypothetical protein
MTKESSKRDMRRKRYPLPWPTDANAKEGFLPSGSSTFQVSLIAFPGWAGTFQDMQPFISGSLLFMCNGWVCTLSNHTHKHDSRPALSLNSSFGHSHTYFTHLHFSHTTHM